jgi:hypothetical protein
MQPTHSPTSLILRLKAILEVLIAAGLIGFSLLVAYAIRVEWQ